MIGAFAKKLFGTVNDRIIKSINKLVVEINEFEPKIKAMSNEELKNQTQILRDRLSKGESLDDILTYAFAVVREASSRVLNMRHFDVQLIGGIVLHRGMIPEMRTGEGKTLVATLAAYLNALEGKGVHMITVNDYLAKRDSQWMGKIYEFLGLTVGCIVHDLGDEERAEAYAADITHGTNNEFGFDYLRDNMKYSRDEMVQRPFNFAIIDEVDSILIDEARTPLIISGPTEDNSELYHKMNKIIPTLLEADYEIDEKNRTVVLTEEGSVKIEQLLKDHKLLEQDDNLYDVGSISLVHHLNQALRAHKLFTLDKDYIVKDDKVIIIDEFTGRMMEGRRYSEGLHQALEAKENVRVQNENQTLASITFQNYFRLYPKIAGMTGTAMTEASEFSSIYKLETVEIPTNLPVSRTDEDDEIYLSAREKYDAIIKTIEECNAKGQPVLVGTVSIEKSELVAKILKKKKIAHQVLNAKHHEKEAFIIAQAGRLGAVTIATNMAGRGTDIMLGGNPDMLVMDALKGKNDPQKEAKIKEQVAKDKEAVIKAGGLYVIGTERHESRRIDNQLRGRSGRQGDPGGSKFYLSLEDDLMRIFASDKLATLLPKLGLKEGEAIAHGMVSRVIAKAQNKVEQHNFEIRKNLLRFDDVMNDQRKVIYEQRLEIMESSDLSEVISDMSGDVLDNIIINYIPPHSYFEQWDIESLTHEVYRIFALNLPVSDWAKEEAIAENEIKERINKAIFENLAEKSKKYGSEIMHLVEKKILLLSLDQLWKDHLHSLDHLRQGIGLRAYGQKDPLNEFKKEAFAMFHYMLDSLRETAILRLSHMELAQSSQNSEAIENVRARPQKMIESRGEDIFGQPAKIELVPVVRRINPEERKSHDPSSWGKVSRNEDCPCGSGKKYKFCHGKI